MMRKTDRKDGAAGSTVPFTKETMLDEFKLIVLAIAGHVANIAGEPRVPGAVDPAQAFIGFSSDERDLRGDEPYGAEEAYIDRIDLRRFELTAYLDGAYDFAFQIEHYWSYDEVYEQRLRWLEAAVPMTSASGTVLAFRDPKQRSPVRHVLKMAAARWWLEAEDHHHIPIDDLALLAGMTEAAVRNAFSAEGIKPERPFANQPVGLYAVDARAWLAKRRGFVPTRTRQEQTEELRRQRINALLAARDLDRALDEIAEARGIPRAEFGRWLARRAAVDDALVESLLSGSPMLDLDALERVARALDLDAPRFAATAVEVGLRKRAHGRSVAPTIARLSTTTTTATEENRS